MPDRNGAATSFARIRTMSDRTWPALTAPQIARCGMLLVQHLLLVHGIESAAVNTPAGMDLVAFVPGNVYPHRILVKATTRPRPAAGRGKDALDWWIPENISTEFTAVVDLSTTRAWIFKSMELPDLAQQWKGGFLHLYMFTDPTHRPQDRKRLVHDHQFDRYLLANRLSELFPSHAARV